MKKQSEFEKTFHTKGFWVYEYIHYVKETWNVKNDYFLIFLLFILPPFFIFLPELLTRMAMISHFSIFTFLSLFFAFCASFLGPLAIYSWHKRIITFYHSLKMKNEKEQKVVDLVFQKCLKKFHQNNLWMSIPWIVIVLSVFLFKPSSMNGYGFHGFTDFYFILLLFYIAFLLHLCAVAVVIVIISVKLIVCFSKEKDFIQNSLQNNSFQIKIFGNFTFYTTIYFTCGLCYIPIILDFCKNNQFETANIALIPVFVYLFFLFYSFTYPNYKICSIANHAKQEILDQFEKKYIQCIKTLETNQEVTNQMYTMNLYYSINYLKGMDIYPTSVRKVIMIFSTVIFPVAFFLLDKLDFIYKPFFQVLFQ